MNCLEKNFYKQQKENDQRDSSETETNFIDLTIEKEKFPTLFENPLNEHHPLENENYFSNFPNNSKNKKLNIDLSHPKIYMDEDLIKTQSPKQNENKFLNRKKKSYLNSYDDDFKIKLKSEKSSENLDIKNFFPPHEFIQDTNLISIDEEIYNLFSIKKNFSSPTNNEKSTFDSLIPSKIESVCSSTSNLFEILNESYDDKKDQNILNSNKNSSYKMKFFSSKQKKNSEKPKKLFNILNDCKKVPENFNCQNKELFKNLLKHNLRFTEPEILIEKFQSFFPFLEKELLKKFDSYKKNQELFEIAPRMLAEDSLNKKINTLFKDIIQIILNNLFSSELENKNEKIISMNKLTDDITIDSIKNLHLDSILKICAEKSTITRKKSRNVKIPKDVIEEKLKEKKDLQWMFDINFEILLTAISSLVSTSTIHLFS